jgi:NAD(P)-dependent dehydrogenase (short-subunit alcohol dehydrogenase family)
MTSLVPQEKLREAALFGAEEERFDVTVRRAVHQQSLRALFASIQLLKAGTGWGRAVTRRRISLSENFTMSAAFELAERGVTANVVAPPVTDTGWVTDEVRRLVEERTDLIHVATPTEVAEVIAFLCSEASRLVTANRIELR